MQTHAMQVIVHSEKMHLKFGLNDGKRIRVTKPDKGSVSS